MKKPPPKPSILPNFKRFFDKIFKQRPFDQNDLFHLLRRAKTKKILGNDALSMIEGVLHVSEYRVIDVMLPRSRMVVIDRKQSPEQFLPKVIECAHSRIPVVDDDPSKVVGVLLVKDLLPFCIATTKVKLDLNDIMRTAILVPENKPLDIMLREFRASRNHMAIVVDEYGMAVGMITIEDVLEQIVGEIEDEFDLDEELFIFDRGRNEFTIKANTPIQIFNKHFNLNFNDNSFDTVGGLVVHGFGYIPSRDQKIQLNEVEFQVLRADERRVHLLKIKALNTSTLKQNQSISLNT